MASLRYQAAHKFIEQHAGKSKQDILLEIAKISNSDVVDDLLYYLMNGYLPREEKIRIRRLINSTSCEITKQIVYHLYLLKEFQILTFKGHKDLSDDPYDDFRGRCETIAEMKKNGSISSISPDENGVYIIDRLIGSSYTEQFIYDIEKDSPIEFRYSNIHWISLDYEKMLPKNLYHRFMINPDRVALFEESLLNQENLAYLEKKNFISPTINIPREFIKTRNH